MAYKVFANGFPLQASELNTYLMQQAIAVFIDGTSRDAAITAPVEGQFAYLTASSELTKYSGTVWESFGLAPLTPSSLVVTDGSGELAVSATVSLTELNYVDGVTSSIQTQLNGKVDEVNGEVTTAATGSTVVRNITLSTADPSGGSDGAVWLKYTP